MAGAGSAEERWAWVSEVTAGTIPTSPSFNLTSLETVAITATPNVREQRQKYANRRRSGISRSGFPVEGTGNGQLVYGVYDDLLASLLQGSWQSNVLKDSTTGQSTFAWERTIPAGAGGASRYFRYKGVEVSGGSLT